jgi:hypothetical protein
VFLYSHSAAPCLNQISGATSKHSNYRMQFTSLYYLASLPTAFFRTPEHTCLIIERAEMRHIASSHTASHPILIVELPTLRDPARRTSGPCTRLLSIGAQMQTSYSTVVSRLIWTKYLASVGELSHTLKTKTKQLYLQPNASHIHLLTILFNSRNCKPRISLELIFQIGSPNIL